MTWERDDSGLSLRDVERKQAYRFEAHHFVVMKRMPWLRCKSCGLLTLRNELTAWTMKMGCNASDHPEYVSRCRNARPRSAS